MQMTHKRLCPCCNQYIDYTCWWILWRAADGEMPEEMTITRTHTLENIVLTFRVLDVEANLISASFYEI